MSILCKGTYSKTNINGPATNENDLIQERTKRGLCSCGTTKLRSYYRFGWHDIPGAECYNCPDSIHRRTLELTNADLTKKVAVQAALELTNADLMKKVYTLTTTQAEKLIGNTLFGNHFRSKTRKILLLKDQAAAEAAAAQSNVGKQQKINDDLKEKLAAAESKFEKERKKNDDLNEKLEDAAAEEAVAKSKLATAESKFEKERKTNHDLIENLAEAARVAVITHAKHKKQQEQLESEAADARAEAASAVARAAAAATRAAAKFVAACERSADFEDKLSAAEAANARVVALSSSRAAKIQRLETAAAETARVLKEATRISKIYKNSWSYHFWPPPPS